MVSIICFIDEWRRKLTWIRCGRFESALCFNNCDKSSATSTDKTTSSTQLGGLFGEKVETVETNLAQLRYCVENFFIQDAQHQKALFLCTIGQGALEI